MLNGLVPRPAPSVVSGRSNPSTKTNCQSINGIAPSKVYKQNKMDDSVYVENYEALQKQINEIMILIRQPINMEEVWAITKIWAVKDDLRRVLNYIENPDKTKKNSVMGLKEVLSYTTQGYKQMRKNILLELIANLVHH